MNTLEEEWEVSRNVEGDDNEETPSGGMKEAHVISINPTK